MISDEALQEYKAIYRKEFGKDISDKDALEQAISLLNLMRIVYRPIKKEWLKELDERDAKAKKEKG